MAQKGYIIFALDNRGSAGRGHLFEEPIHYRFGAQEMSRPAGRCAISEIAALRRSQSSRYLGLELRRHMTLHAMFEDPEDFKAGFAGGRHRLALLRQHLYGAITSACCRNMSKAMTNLRPSRPPAIEREAVDRARHGRRQCALRNTLVLIDELIESGKYVEVMPFPGPRARRRRSTRPPRLMTRVTQFFLDNL